ncbi:MAG: peptidase M28, partial [Gemmatimonadaceae bacterium]
ETEAYCQDVIRAVTGQESQGERPHQAGDYSFNNIGISSFFMLLSTMIDSHREELGYYAVGGCGANIAWHTEEDLIHIADRDILDKDIKIYLSAVMGVANATIAPFNFRKTLQTFRSTLDKYESGANGAYSFVTARTAIDELDGALDTFGTHAAALTHSAVSDQRVRRANAAIRRLARLLVPVNYTKGPEFFHDPAETTPPLPDLAMALNAPTMDASEIGFLRTHLMRGENRLVAALRDARRVLEEAMA